MKRLFVILIIAAIGLLVLRAIYDAGRDNMKLLELKAKTDDAVHQRRIERMREEAGLPTGSATRHIEVSTPAPQRPLAAPRPASTPDPAAVRAEIERKYGTRPTQ